VAEYGIVKGKRLRATLVDSCGMPIQGPRSRIVTSGFVTVTASPQMREAQDLESTNADGAVCVSDRTRAERKWWNVTLELCKVNTDLYNMLMDWELVLGHDGEAIGFSDKKDQPDNRGVAIEIWTGVGSEDECDEIPDDDDILIAGATGSVAKYGYVLFGVVKEFALAGDLQIGAQVSTFSLAGRTGSPTRWGRGPYNVVATDSSNTPGRLLAPIKPGQHLRTFETTIPPPDPTDGACPLVLPNPYYGNTAAATAPEQPACDAVATNEEQSITISGSPTGGDYTLSFMGQTTAAIAYNANAAAVETALEGLSTIGANNVTVTGTAPFICEFVGDLAEMNLPTMTADGSGLTGGTDPDVTIATVQNGGQY